MTRVLLWLDDRRTCLLAAYRTRRMFRRHKLTPAAQARLREMRRAPHP